MIVARITDQLRNRNPKTPGSTRIEGYEHWFPLSSADFSFSGSSGAAISALGNKNEPLDAATFKKLMASESAKSSSDHDEPDNHVSCGKYVDVATSALMHLSILDKQKNREDVEDTMAADIHFVEVGGGSLTGDEQGKASIIPYLKVAMEVVTVESWSLSGSGDDRPTESFTLKFEKIAIQYTAFDEKGNQKPSNARGFDQRDYGHWTPASWKGKRR